MRNYNAFRWFVLLILAAGLSGCAACGSNNDPEPDASNNGEAPDVEVDMGGGEDMTAEPEVGPDGGEDAAVDMTPDMRPTDTDGDLIPDPDDNCPDDANPEQEDRDRDGLGDLCDTLPFVHDPTNPGSIQRIIEDEMTQPNDTSFDALENTLALPFMASGVVGEIDNGDPDLDFYIFEVDEPTAILVNLESNTSMWGGAILLGTTWSNANAWRVHITPDLGTAQEREMFLPYPGAYAIVVSDSRNFIETQPDVGGAGFDYRLTVGRIPLPEATPVELPTVPLGAETDGTLHNYVVSAADLAGLTATMRGIPADENSFMFPQIVILDEADSRTLAATSLGQVGDDARVSVSAKFSGRETVRVIEDYAQAFGASQSSLTLEAADLRAETETSSAPADSRLDDVPWVAPGEAITATIDQPRAGLGDVDYFLFMLKRGEVARLTVTPLQNSLMEPLVQVGNLVEQQGSSYFISLHQAPEAAAGAPASVEYLVTADEDGEFAVAIQHEPNRFGNPVGGSLYGYDATIETLAPMPVDLGMPPGQVQLQFADGKFGLAKFSAPAGDLLTVREESTLFADLRVIDASTFDVLGIDSGSLTFAVPTDGDYWVELHDFLGRGTGMDPATVYVEPVTMTPLGALPATQDAVLDLLPTHLYQFTATAGQAIDFRVYTGGAFFPQIQLFDAALNQVGNTSYQRKQVIIPADGDYIVGISASSGTTNPTYAYRLGIEVIQPADLGALPAATSGVLDNRPFAVWTKVPVSAQQTYAASFTASGGYFGQLAVYDPSDMTLLRSSVEGIARWVSSYDGEAWIAYFDQNNDGNPAYGYDIDVRAVMATPATLGAPVAAQLADGADEDLFTFTSIPGMIEAVVTPVGDWRPQIRLLRGDALDRESDARETGNVLRFAVSDMAVPYAVVVRSQDQTLAGPLDYTVTMRILDTTGAMAEIEPNDVLGQAQPLVMLPAVVNGTTTATDLGDRFGVPLVRWQRLWFLSADRNMNGPNRFDAVVRIHDDLDNVVASNSYSGEGFMPALYGYHAPQTGNFELFYGPRMGTTVTGDYSVYVVVSPVTDVAESEPNDSMMAPHALGPLSGLTRVAASVDAMGDAVDVVSFDVGQSNADVWVTVDGAPDEHSLRLLDSTGVEIAASGPAHDGLTQPLIALAGQPASTYFVELTSGPNAGTFDVLLLVE